MSTLSDIRNGVNTVLEAANPNLHVYPYEPGAPMEYPALVLEPTEDINYNLAAGGNSFRLDLVATLHLRHAGNDVGWAEMDKYRSPTGAESIKAGVATDPTLNGSVDTAHVALSDKAARNNRESAYWQFSARFVITALVTAA